MCARMPSTLRWLLIHTSTPALIRSRTISAKIWEKPIARSGSSWSLSGALATTLFACTPGFALEGCASHAVDVYTGIYVNGAR